MIKGISAVTNLGKKTAMTAIFAGLMAYGASTSAKAIRQNNIVTTPNELVSKDFASALKSNVVAQTTPVVPSTHNTKLDNTLRKFIETEEDKAYIEDFIKTAYDKFGLFLGSAIIQHEIDVQQLYALMTGNTKVQIKNNINPEYAKQIEAIGPEFFKSIKPNEDFIMNWMNNKFTPNLLKELTAFDHKPTAEELDSKISYVLSRYANFTRDEALDYVVYSDNFNHHRLHEEKDDQSRADLIAYKMFMFDRICIQKQLAKSPVLSDEHYMDDKKPFIEYLDQWMESVAPKGKY